MAILLDTHAYLWFLSRDGRLPTSIREAIESSEDAVVSVVSGIEVAIKTRTGKLVVQGNIQTIFSEDLDSRRLRLLPVQPHHLATYVRLPDPENGHRDPFDRLLVAQAQAEGLTLVSRDERLDAYAVRRLW